MYESDKIIKGIMNPTDKGTYKKADPSEIIDVNSDDHVTVDKKSMHELVE